MRAWPLTVVAISSADGCSHAWQQRLRGLPVPASLPNDDGVLDRLVPGDERVRPVVSVHDGASHTLAWLGSAFGVRQLPLGVDRFGESGTIEELYQLDRHRHRHDRQRCPHRPRPLSLARR